jgi:hypothetical protein
MGRLGSALALAFVLALAVAAPASAATRYAAPGGTGADPCESASQPCSLYTAADQNAPGTTVAPGDVVEVATGTYTEDDLGPNDSVQVAGGVTVRGRPGEPAPLIVLETDVQTSGAFYIGAGAKVVDLEIRHEGGAGPAVTITIGGTAEQIIARSTGSTFFTCQILEGTLRDSVCLNESDGIAMGASSATFVGTHTVTLRNVTAIATGIGARGADFAYFASAAGTNVNISAKSSLIKGDFTDLVVRGQSLGGGGSPGANTVMTLEHSDYAEAETFTSGTGTASVTAPGTNDNITAPPLLEADGYHQLPASPTVDAGAVDIDSGLSDIDGQLRSIGLAPDIGADELGNPTTTTVNCNPITLDSQGIGQSACTVTVEDVGVALSPPSGDVIFRSPTGLAVEKSCTLIQGSEASSSCSVIVSANAGDSGPQAVVAEYGGDGSHEGSEGTGGVSVIKAPLNGGGSGGGGTGEGGTAGAGGSNTVSGSTSGGAAGTGSGTGGGGTDPAPTTQIKKHPGKLTTKLAARFTFGSNESGAQFECKLDRRPFRACASPFKKKVKLGRHTFKVRAVDTKGQVDPTPAVFRWEVVGLN